MKIKSRSLTNGEIIDALIRIDGSEGFRAISLPIKFLWELKKGIAKLEDIKKQFDSMVADIDKVYSDDGHSVPIEGEKGHMGREVRKEYIDEFIQKKKELLEAENEVTLPVFSIEDLGDGSFTLEILQALSPFIDDVDD